MRKFLLFGIFCFLSACAATDTDFSNYLVRRGVPFEKPETLKHCQGYGCQKIMPVNITKSDWQKINALFTPRPKNAAQERAAISKSIGIFETIAGAQTGTDNDVAGTFRKTGPGQMDCVDESTNTTTYLATLNARKLLKFHTIEGPTMRLPLIHAGRWPHQTAVIRDKKTGAHFAVDSWFQDNGSPADIINLDAWKNGWKPENADGFL